MKTQLSLIIQQTLQLSDKMILHLDLFLSLLISLPFPTINNSAFEFLTFLTMLSKSSAAGCQMLHVVHHDGLMHSHKITLNFRFERD